MTLLYLDTSALFKRWVAAPARTQGVIASPLDTSALFKRWVAEAGSEALLGGIEEDASAVGRP